MTSPCASVVGLHDCDAANYVPLLVHSAVTAARDWQERTYLWKLPVETTHQPLFKDTVLNNYKRDNYKREDRQLADTIT